jgi:heme/copper-type cytochrome/quinol oxidase subunit 2
MLAAEIWHWWIGVIVTLLVFGMLVALIAMYLSTVTSQKYEPGSKKRKRQPSDL